MIREKMYEKVQLFKRLRYSRSKISSDLEIDPRTAAKYYAMDERQFKTYRREHMFRDKVFEEFNEKSRPSSEDNTPPIFQNASFGNPQIPRYEHPKDSVDCRHPPCGLSNLSW